jgi:hypothetical protein
LRSEVENLLANHSDSQELLSRSAMDVAAEHKKERSMLCYTFRTLKR